MKYTEERVVEMIHRDYSGKKILVLAPVVRSRKGHYRELFDSLRRKGYLYVRVDGGLKEITEGMKLDRYKNHDIEVVIDKMMVKDNQDENRLKKSLTTVNSGSSIEHIPALLTALCTVYDCLFSQMPPEMLLHPFLHKLFQRFQCLQLIDPGPVHLQAGHPAEYRFLSFHLSEYK